jgi:hypothetical protein
MRRALQGERKIAYFSMEIALESAIPTCSGGLGVHMPVYPGALRFADDPAGAARAAKLSGDTEKAKTYYAKLLTICDHADGDRPELQDARSVLAQK